MSLGQSVPPSLRFTEHDVLSGWLHRIVVLLVVCSGVAMAQSPALFYSDLPGGMCAGGRNNLGHIITVFGKNFGTAQDAGHYVTIAGAQASTYLLWQDDKIAFQPGCAVSDGDYTITVTTPTGTSNALPFHIYSGARIYFLDQANGNDANSGEFTAPFKTLTKCRSMASALPGNTCYLMPGTVQKVVDTQPGSFAAFLNMSVAKGLPAKYIGVIGYPTADPNLVPKIGCDYLGGDCPTSSVMGGRVYKESYAVVANLHVYFSKPYPGLQVGGPGFSSHHVRIANLEFTSQNTDYIMAVQTIEASFLQFNGLYIHDIYDRNDSKHVGGIYVGESAHDVDIGWTTEDFSCAYKASNPCHINKMIEFHATRQSFNMPAPTVSAGMVAAAGSSMGKLPAGTYDVQLTYRSRVYSPSHTVPSPTETTGSAVQKVTLDGVATNAIRVTAPAGYDHSPTWDDGVSMLCNPALAYRVYICRENGGACTPQYQGESLYSKFSSPGSSTAPVYVQTSALASGAATPAANTTDMSGCNIYNVAVHDSKFIAAPGYSFPIDDVGTDKGYIRFYNNEIINSGNNAALLGSEPLANMCFYVMDQDPDARDYAAGGDIEFYNNTFYNCGKPGGNSQGVFMFYWPDPTYPLKRIVLRNNIFVQPQSGQAWMSAGSTPNGANAQIVGSNNLCFGYAGSNCPATWNSEGGAVHADPLFTAAGTPTADPSGTGGVAYFGSNLTPRAGSPAIDAGNDTTAVVGHDRVAVLRPQNSIVDIGPYEYFAGVTADTIPPAVSISSPASGTVSGTITLTATCSDNVAVSTLQFTLDGADYGTAFTGAGTHSTAVDTTKLSNASHSIGAVCTDTSSNAAFASPVSVTVNNVSAPAPTPAPTASLTASNSTIALGSAVTLSWQTTNASTCSLNQGIGSVACGSSSISVTPAASGTVTYTLTATGAGGTITAATQVSVTAAPPTATLTVSPRRIRRGASATLSWSTANASSASISGIGTVGPSGSLAVSPAATTTYTLTATGPSGTATASATLKVSGK